MAGNPANAAVWANADVYIGSMTATMPVGSADFSSDWDAVGLLSGDDGFTEQYGLDSSDFFAWGGILVATTRRHFKLTRQFTAYEDNPTMMDLWYPGNTIQFGADGTSYEGDIVTPDLQASFKIGFQTLSGGTLKRVVSSNYAQVDDRGDSKEGESDLASREVTVVIYPDETGKLFHTFKGPIPASTAAAAA